MPDSRHHPLRPDGSTEDRFLRWVDHLVDPASGTPPPPDPDFVDVAETATSVHRAAGLGTMTAPPTARTDAIWESLMHTSTASAIPVHPGAFDDSAPPPQAPPRPIAIAPRPGWRSYLMVAALIAVIVAAGTVALWQITGPHGDQSPDVANQPGIVASATPATESADGCDLTRDILVFTDDTPSFDGTDLDPTLAVVQPDGDLVITCDGVTDPEPLMTGIADAMPLQWPGTVLLERENGSTVVYNVATGAQVELGDNAIAHETIYAHQPSPAWLVSPNNAAATDWRITSLETMKSFALSDELGGVLPEARTISILASYESPIAVISFDARLIPAGGLDQNLDLALPPNPDDATTVEVPDESLVVDSTFETRRWIDTWGQTAVSPDGSTIAYQTQDDLTPMVRVEDAITGDVLAEITDVHFIGSTPMQFAFSGDGEALVYIDGNDVWIATWDGGLATMQVETGDMRPSAVSASSMPNRVIIEQITNDDVGGQAISVLDTNTARITNLGAQHTDSRLGFSNRWSQLDYVVTMMPSADSSAETVLQLIDLHTGRPVLTSKPLQQSIDTLLGFTHDTVGISGEVAQANVTIAYSSDGAVAVVNVRDGQSIIFNAYEGTVTPVTVELDESSSPVDDMTWTIVPSSDGRMLYGIGSPSATNEGIRVTSPDDIAKLTTFVVARIATPPIWSDPIAADPVGLIRGIPTRSATNDETRTLEAQEITPIAASPAATPDDAHAACDLSADIPVVTNADAFPLDRTVAVLNDGTLSLHCDGTSTVVATGVTTVQGTSWPGAIILSMADGTLRGVNLLTGASSNLGPASALSERIPSVTAPFLDTRGLPWLALPANAEATDWRFIDLRTMESFLLSDDIGGQLSHSTVVVPYALTPNAAVIGFPGIPISPAHPAPDATIATRQVENAALVIDGTLSNRHWTSVTHRTRNPASISPDGRLVALEAPSHTGFTVRVEQFSTGELVANTGIDYTTSDDIILLNDGLLHLTGNRLDLVTWEPEIATQTLLELDAGQEATPQDVPSQTSGRDAFLLPTATSDVVIVVTRNPDGNTAGFLVNTSTGKATNIPHLLSSSLLMPAHSSPNPPRYILTATPAGENDDRSTIQLIDVTTGEPVAGSDPVDIAPGQLSQQPSMLRAHGTVGVSVYQPGHAVVLNATTGETFTIESQADAFYLSRDGTYISAPMRGGTGPSLLLRELIPDAEWVEASPDALITDFPGMQGLP